MRSYSDFQFENIYGQLAVIQAYRAIVFVCLNVEICTLFFFLYNNFAVNNKLMLNLLSFCSFLLFRSLDNLFFGLLSASKYNK